MIDSLLKLALVLLVFFGPLLFAWGMYKLVVRSERKEWKKKFDAIHRGDKFIQWSDNDNPYKRQYGQVVEITGKASVRDKRFYLEYKIGGLLYQPMILAVFKISLMYTIIFLIPIKTNNYE